MRKKWATYQAISDEFKEETCNDGAKTLCNPIEEAGEDGNVSSDGQSERDRRIQVAAGDVGGHCHPHKQCKCMSHRHSHQARWVKSRVGCELVYMKLTPHN